MARKKDPNYVPDPSGFLSEDEAQEWGEECARILSEKNATPEDDSAPEIILAAASDKGSTLHKYLEWDDHTAGHQHRLTQCRFYIRHVYIKVSEEVETAPVRAFVSVIQSNGNGRTYKPIQSIDVDEQAQLVDRARCELIRWEKQYKTYKNIHEISRLVKGVSGLLSMDLKPRSRKKQPV